MSVPPAGPEPEAPRRAGSRAGPLALHGGVTLLWLLAWYVARVQEYAPHASLWFPPAGVTFAAGLVLGWRGLPGVLLAATLATLTLADGAPAASPGTLLPAGLAFGLAHGLSYIAGARLLLHLGRVRPTPRFVSLLLVIAPLAALLASVSGLMVLVAFGLIESLALAGDLVVPFWIGDLVGAVAVGPFCALLLGAAQSRLGLEPAELFTAHRQVVPAASGRGPLALKLGLCVLPAMGAAALVRLWPEQAYPASFLVFFGIVPLMWVAHTEGALRTYVATAALSTAIAGLGSLLGPGQHGLTFQFAMIILAGSAYFGITVPALYADNRALRLRLTTDSLTGAATRAFLLETAEREVERARRFGTPVSLVVFDLDHFKRVNDELGHAFGDAALVELARRTRGELRASDLLARPGGEEFVALLPMTGLAAAVEIAGRLAGVLRSVPVSRSGDQRTVTASFGVTEIEVARQESFEAAFERADRALYEAKAAGRDRVRVAPAPD
ncbi:MAG: sensor domain-containing diguanylate cyclase [Thermoanaerobaculia bacterium]|nr:MAG: sensor domain-containing diguanylate cyclase [Thermoanaerobaculia bacterium]MBZ0101058.1 diguanylate cyclase [Thermoanaerobaculia bacterium]